MAMSLKDRIKGALKNELNAKLDKIADKLVREFDEFNQERLYGTRKRKKKASQKGSKKTVLSTERQADVREKLIACLSEHGDDGATSTDLTAAANLSKDEWSEARKLFVDDIMSTKGTKGRGRRYFPLGRSKTAKRKTKKTAAKRKAAKHKTKKKARKKPASKR